MSIEGQIVGNLLGDPVQRVVPGRDGQQRVTEFRMMSDVWKQGGSHGELLQDDARTSTSGDMPESGLDVLNQDGDSIEVALARQLVD